MILKNEGRYDLTIQSEDKSGISEVEIDGHAVAFDTATGTCPAEDELGGGTDSSVTCGSRREQRCSGLLI